MKNKTNLMLFTMLMCASMFVVSCDKSATEEDFERINFEKVMSNPNVRNDVDYVAPEHVQQIKQEYEETQKRMRELDSINRAKQIQNIKSKADAR